MHYHVYFRRPRDCVVYTPATEHHEVSLVRRVSDATWHCALCDDTRCRHARAVLQVLDEADGDAAETSGGLFTVPLPNG